ncbi:MAG: MarR family transcriptional regulator [Woeseiaceae bacterium]
MTNQAKELTVQTVHDVTPQVVVEFTRKLLRLMEENKGGETTLNELRIMNQIIICDLKDRCCSVTSLHKVTGISLPTVSRIVAHLQYMGWVCQRQDPDDGRKRIISLCADARKQCRGETDSMVEWINEFRKHGLAD